MKVKIKDVKELLHSGKSVKVKTIGGEYAPITDYIEKGIKRTYKVSLDNGRSIKVSDGHLFFTNCGWLQTKDLKSNIHSIKCEDDAFSIVKSVDYIGEYPIVDITVNHPESCYYGNGMLNHNSGKTLLAMHALAETQKKGGMAVFIDTEASLDQNFVRAIGVDLKKLLYISCDHVEEIFDHIEAIVQKIRMSNKDKLVTIVVDSVAAASCRTEMESDHGKDGYATAKAIILSKAMRKITQMLARQRVCLLFTNQLRVKMNAMFGDPYTTSGGKALAFHASLRLRLQAVGQIKDSKKNTIGIKTACKVIKNRMGPPMRKVEFDLFFDRGMDNYGNWLDTLKDEKVLKKAYTKEQKDKMLKKDPDALKNLIECDGKGTKYQYLCSDGNTYEFLKSNLVDILGQNSLLKEDLYKELCEIHIMKYKDQSACESEDIEYEDEGVDD